MKEVRLRLLAITSILLMCSCSNAQYDDSEISIAPLGSAENIEVEIAPGDMICIIEAGERSCVPIVHEEG